SLRLGLLHDLFEHGGHCPTRDRRARAVRRSLVRRFMLAALLPAGAAAPAYAGGSFMGVASGSQAVWVRGPVGVLRPDPRTGKVAADSAGAGVCCHSRRLLRVDAGGRLSSPYRLPLTNPIWTTAGSLWLAGRNLLYRLDPRTGRVVARLPLPEVVDLAAGAGS